MGHIEQLPYCPSLPRWHQELETRPPLLGLCSAVQHPAEPDLLAHRPCAGPGGGMVLALSTVSLAAWERGTWAGSRFRAAVMGPGL